MFLPVGPRSWYLETVGEDLDKEKVELHEEVGEVERLSRFGHRPVGRF